jgi:hypothetical protein
VAEVSGDVVCDSSSRQKAPMQKGGEAQQQRRALIYRLVGVVELDGHEVEPEHREDEDHDEPKERTHRQGLDRNCDGFGDILPRTYIHDVTTDGASVSHR